MSDDDNIPYRLTAEYRRAAEAAAEQNQKQRRGAHNGYAPMFDGEPWSIPEVNIIHQEAFSPFHPADFYLIKGSSENQTHSPRKALRIETWDMPWTNTAGIRAVFELEYSWLDEDE